MKYKRLNVKVKAFRFGIDEDPVWFEKAWADGYVSVLHPDKFPAFGYIHSGRGDIRFESGEWVVKGKKEAYTYSNGDTILRPNFQAYSDNEFRRQFRSVNTACAYDNLYEDAEDEDDLDTLDAELIYGNWAGITDPIRDSSGSVGVFDREHGLAKIDNVVYRIMGDNKCKIVSISSHPDKRDIVLDYIETDDTRYSLTEICSSAFDEDDFEFTGARHGLSSVTIGDSVERIGTWAFANCCDITSITFGKSVKVIGEGAFDGCSGITTLDLPASVEYIGRVAFRGCVEVGTVVLREGLKYICSWAFMNCCKSKGASFTIPSTVEYIGKEAFDHCHTNTLTFVAPQNIQLMGKHPFYDCFAHEVIYNGSRYEWVAEILQKDIYGADCKWTFNEVSEDE